VGKYYFFLVSSLILTSINAQRGWEIGGGAGISHYFGDLNTGFNLSKPGPSIGAAARYNFNSRICTKLSANYGRISADDKDSKNEFEKERNLNFRSNVWDASAQMEFNFLTYEHGSKDNFFTPYASLGFSVFSFNPKTTFNGKTYNLREYGTEGQFRGEEYYTIVGAFNYGFGVKFDVTPVWSVNIEVSARKSFSDYLDDVSTVYPDMKDIRNLRGEVAPFLSDPTRADLGSQPIGVKNRQRGNQRNNDHYVFTHVSLMYYFGSIRCPKVLGY
jgi:hypothetical protein